MMHSTPAVFQYKVIFISDLHLGSNKTATPYLYEFLKHLDYKTLEEIWLVGDIVGGWEHQNAKQQPLPEMEKRIIDCLNYAASRGIRINFLPGNHDEKLRPLLPTLNSRKRFDVFGRSVQFMNEAYYETKSFVKQKFKVIHGDQHDPELFVKIWFRPFVFAISWLYDILVAANYHYSKAMYDNFGIHSSFAQPIKSNFKKMIGFVFSNKDLLRGQDTGIIYGHIHTPGSQKFDMGDRVSYLINTGDWVENATAAVVANCDEVPEILNYKIEREKRGFGALPDVMDEHPAHFAAMRKQTNRQVKLLQRLWPARNRKKQLQEYAHSHRKIREHENDLATLNSIMNTLNAARAFCRASKEDLADILQKTTRDSYSGQKTGLARIFEIYAPGQKLTDEDFVFTRVVVREFMTRAERKIQKHTQNRNRTAKKLDFARAEKRHRPHAAQKKALTA